MTKTIALIEVKIPQQALRQAQDRLWEKRWREEL